MDKMQLLIEQRSQVLKEMCNCKNELSHLKSTLSIIEIEIKDIKRLKNRFNLRSV